MAFSGLNPRNPFWIVTKKTEQKKKKKIGRDLNLPPRLDNWLERVETPTSKVQLFRDLWTVNRSKRPKSIRIVQSSSWNQEIEEIDSKSSIESNFRSLFEQNDRNLNHRCRPVSKRLTYQTTRHEWINWNHSKPSENVANSNHPSNSFRN